MKTDFERFNSKIAKKDCWEWTGCKYRGGYGNFRRKVNGKWIMEKTHRFSYEYYNNIKREDMRGLIICHKCDNPSCVNPDHLFLGTYLDNALDAKSKNRNSYGRHKQHKWLSFEIAEAIRKLKTENPNLTYKQISKIYNTSASQVHRIIKNLIWKKRK